MSILNRRSIREQHLLWKHWCRCTTEAEVLVESRRWMQRRHVTYVTCNIKHVPRLRVRSTWPAIWKQARIERERPEGLQAHHKVSDESYEHGYIFRTTAY